MDESADGREGEAVVQQQPEPSRSRPTRRRLALGGVGLIAVVTAVVALALPATADVIEFGGQGTTDGACSTLIEDATVPAGRQIWQFNLSQTQPGATITATFSDGTTVTDQPESSHQGNTSFFLIETDLGATLISASATFTPADGNSQFVVSHCNISPPPPTTTTTPPAPAPPATAPVPVVGAPRFTG